MTVLKMHSGAGWALIPALALMLAACGGQTEAEKKGEVAKSADTDVTVKIAGGDMRVQEGVSQDVVLPAGLAKMPGAKALRAAQVVGNPGVGNANTVEIEVPGSVADASAYYKAELARIGAKIEMDVEANGNAVLSAKATGGERLMISIRNGDAAGTSVVGVSAMGTK